MKNYMNFKNLTFIGLLFLAFQNYKTRNTLNELKAEIKSAKELTQDEIKKITKELSDNFNSKIKLNYNHDESLIGGLKIQIGSLM